MLNTMKSRFTGKKLLVLFFIMTVSLFSQGWNDVVPTLIPYINGTGTGIDEFTNKDGISVLVDYHSYTYPNHIYYLKYYLLNSSGSIIRSYTFENQEVEFVNIDGDNDKIYVVYKLGNQLKTRKSTNAGISWTNDSNILPINIGNNTCNHIDITFGKDDNALHVVWATQDAGSDYKTYYRRLYNDVWSSTENVTDGSNVGGFPTVSKSTNRVHVSFNTGTQFDPEVNIGVAKSRDKLSNNWETSQTVQSTPLCFRERIHAGSNKLFDFIYQTHPNVYASDLYVKERTFSSATWSSGQLLQEFSGVTKIVSATNTTDGNTHIVYEGPGSIVHRVYNGTTWSSEFTVGSGYINPSIYSVANDLFVVWGHYGFDNVYFRQYDAAPLAPQNLTVVKSANNHPLLSWTKNNEPDLLHYVIYKKAYEEAGYQYLTTTTTNSFEDLSETYPMPGQNGNSHYVHYKITAVDLHPYESPYSNEVSAKVGGAYLDKQTSGELGPQEYSLDQNYPNPFNPSTKISYSIKEEGLVTLKIYDMLGREMASLVNENKPEGVYEVEFNAANLPSGVYIYRITAMKEGKILFNESKQMLLIK